MRRFPGSWTDTLTKLGFRRRKKSPRAGGNYLRRRARVEALEPRHLLSATHLVTTPANTMDGDQFGVGGGDGLLSLREAVALADDSDRIEFAESLFATGHVTIHTDEGDGTTGRIVLDHDVTVVGPGADLLTIEGDGATGVFSVASTADVHVSGMKVAGGGGGGRGGGFHVSGDLSLDRVRIENNVVDGYGGGIYVASTGTLKLTDCTLDGNQASSGGAIFGHFNSDGPATGNSLLMIGSTISNNISTGSGGGLTFFELADESAIGTITNCTFSGNSAAYGGGLYARNALVDLTIINSTIADNMGTADGGGLYLNQGAKATLHNTIVAANVDQGGTSDDDVRAIDGGYVDSTSSYNLIGVRGNSGLDNDSQGNKVGSTTTPLVPELASLGDYGGPTKTRGLLEGSPALDAGNDDVAVDADEVPLAADQRGGARRVDLLDVPQDGDYATDIGAYEAGASVVLTVTIPDDELDDVTAPDLDFSDLSLREALALAAKLAGPVTITFSSDVVSAGVLELDDGFTLGSFSDPIKSRITIEGPGANLLALDANLAENIFSFAVNSASWELIIRDLTLTGAASWAIREDPGTGWASVTLDGVEIAENGGGVYFADGDTLTITESAIVENDGLGVDVFNGSASILNSTVSGNQSAGPVGGLRAVQSTVTLTNVTVVNNRADKDNSGGSTATGGVYAGNLGAIHLYNTIVADNVAGEDGSDVSADVDRYESGYGGVLAGTHNVIGEAGNSGLENESTNAILDGSPSLIAPLADYGGRTRSHALMLDSPAIDTGDWLLADTLSNDQRGSGFRRRVGTNIDIGAFESEGFPDQIVVNALTDAHDATPLGDGIVDVDLDTPGRQVSLRAAIEEAGALSALQPQTYVISFDPTLAGTIDVTGYGELQIASDLRIEGPGADRVTLDGGDTVRLLHTSGTADVGVSGLKLARGRADASHGGAIFHESSGKLTVDSVVIADSSAGLYGGGIYAAQGPVHVIGSTIQSNSSRLGGGTAASIDYDKAFVIEDSVLRDNDAIWTNNDDGYGGGLYVWGTTGPSHGTTTIANTTFEDNHAVYGGGFYQNVGSMTISDSRFRGNTAQSDATTGLGGAIDVRGGTLTVTSTELTGNVAGQGGAIDLREASLDFTDSTIAGNHATMTGGGMFSYLATADVTRSTIGSNTSAGSAGGVYSLTSTLDLADSVVVGNRADGDGSPGREGIGGGVYTSGTSLTVTTSRFKNNVAGTDGGGLCVRSGSANISDTLFQANTATGRGGGTYLNTGTLDITGSEFGENEAHSAGGLYAKLEDGESATIDRCHFSDNHALATGGGLIVSGSTYYTALIQDTTIDHNRADGSVGGLYVVPGDVSIIGTSITNNTSDLIDGQAAGGGLYVRGRKDTSTDITNCTISGNTTYAGAGIFIYGSETVSDGNVDVVTIASTTITDNTATSLSYVGYGGGIASRDTSNSSVVLLNTIVAGNRAESPNYQDVRGPFDAASSYNLIGYDPITVNGLDNEPTSGSFNRVGGENGAAAVDPRLAPLGNYGGYTLSHALMANSPAIDHGYNDNIPEGIATDQRGLDRTVNFTGAGEIVDIGAVEQDADMRLLADFNGDGRSDSAVLDASSNDLVVSLKTDSGVDTSVWGTLDDGEWTDLLTGDFNGDGRADVVARDAVDSSLVLAISEGDEFHVMPVVDSVVGSTITMSWTEPYVGDFDGDGADELVGRPYYQSDWEVLQFDERLGGTLETDWGGSLRSTSWTTPILVGDANRDGRDDLVALNGSNLCWYVSLSQPAAGSSGQFLPIPTVLDSWGDWFDGYYDAASETLDFDGPYDAFLDIFSEVYNTVELELYPGLMKGIEATAETKAGNDWDQAALLVDRLEEAGFEADIASGQISVPFAVAQAWTGTRSPSAAFAVVRSTLDGNATVVGGNIQFLHAWVQAKLPTATGFSSVNVDPSWKFKDLQAGIDLSGLTSDQGIFDEFDYLAQYSDPTQDPNQLPVEYLEDRVMEYLVDNGINGSLADVPYDGPIIQQQFSTVPVGWGEGAATIGSRTTYENFQAIVGNPTWRDALTHQVTISLDRESVDNRVSGLDFSMFQTSLPEFLPVTSKYVNAQTAVYQGWGGFDNSHGSVSRTTNSEGTPVIELRGTQYVVVQIPSGYSVTDNTCLRFDFESNGAANLERFVGLDRDGDYDSGSAECLLQIETDTYVPGSGVQQITYAIGAPYRDKTSSAATWIVLVLQHPTAGTYVPLSTYARYGNFVLYEAGNTAYDDGVFQQVGAATADLVVDVDSVTDGDQPFQVTRNSVLEFEFKSTSQGRLHAIGWDVDFDSTNDAGQLSERYQLHGTGTEAGYLTTYNNYSGPDWVTYSIPIGAGLDSTSTGDLARLVLVTDAGTIFNAESLFKNFRIREAPTGIDSTHWFESLVIPSVSLSSINVDYCEWHLKSAAPGG